MMHLFKEGKSHQVFILFHGTGGDENSLLGLAQMLDKNAHVLALRGSVNEHGMNRFFKRHRVGLYDFVNLKEETKKVDTFIQKAIKSYHLEDKELIAVGFSNGANMIESLIQMNDSLFNKVALLSPVYLDPAHVFKGVTDLPIFISASTNDPYVTIEDIEKLIYDLKSQGGKVTEVIHHKGHQITVEIVDRLKAWIQQ